MYLHILCILCDHLIPIVSRYTLWGKGKHLYIRNLIYIRTMRSFFSSLLASILGFFISIFLVLLIGGIMLAGVMTAFGDKTTSPKKDMVLELQLNYLIPEQTQENPLLELLNKPDELLLGLDEITYLIERAKVDPNVKGLLIRPGFVSAGFASLEEIRNALLSFKASGKFLYSYNEYIGEKDYFLSSICDSIFLNPKGEVFLDGFNNNVMLYKGLLDKLGVEMELFKVGTHKGAAEVYTQKELSEANRSQIQRYLDEIFHQFASDAANSRGLDIATFKETVADFKIRSAKDAVNLKVVDALWYEDQLADLIKAKVGKKPADKLCFTSLGAYRKMEGPDLRNFSSDNKIAFIYIEGEISNTTDVAGQSSCKSLLKSIRKLKYNEEVKAVVVRVNSPGGSAFASDQLWREIAELKKHKPVIVSMGDVAASGGYYLAVPADTILVSKYTLTGSIGVFALYPNANGLLKDKLGLQFENIKTGKYADIGMPGRGFSVEERQIIQSAVNRIYEDFTSVVSEGRKLSPEHVESVAQGKVWIANDALQHQLVDKIGGRNEAIALAAKMANIDDYKLYYLPKKDDFWSVLSSFQTSIKETALQSELGMLYPAFYQVKQLTERKGVQMLFPFSPLMD
jgi:protease-4